MNRYWRWVWRRLGFLGFFLGMFCMGCFAMCYYIAGTYYVTAAQVAEYQLAIAGLQTRYDFLIQQVGQLQARVGVYFPHVPSSHAKPATSLLP